MEPINKDVIMDALSIVCKSGVTCCICPPINNKMIPAYKNIRLFILQSSFLRYNIQYPASYSLGPFDKIHSRCGLITSSFGIRRRSSAIRSRISFSERPDQGTGNAPRGKV